MSMTYEKRIPLLKDHHTHPSLYTSLNDSLDLRNVSGKAQALELIRARDDEINVVFGWNNSLYSLLGRLKQTKGVIPPLVRMEHCQFISEANAHRARSLGMILSMQPNFSSDSVQYRDRLSGKYCSRNNPFRMLIDTAGFTPGKDLIFGSDGMPHGVKYALEMALFPPVPSQRLTLEEFIAGYCMDTQENGYIDIKVDEDKRTVLSRVVLK